MTTNNSADGQAGITNVPTKLGNLGAMSWYVGTTVVPTDNKIIIKVQGLYLVFAQITFQKDSADDQDNFHIFLYKNGTNTGFGFARNLKSGQYDLGSGSLVAPLDLNVNDVLELYIWNDAGASSTITVVDSQFGVVGI